jgi:hypothetical protein
VSTVHEDRSSASDIGRRHLLWRRGAVIAGLAAVAITQPVLEVLANNPEFFVVGGYSRTQVIVLALSIATIPALLGILAISVAQVIGDRVADVAYHSVVGCLSLLLLLAVLRTMGVDAVIIVALTAIAGAVALVLFVVHTRPGSLLASYLAIAGAVFLGLFLFTGRSGALVMGSSDGEGVTIPRVPSSAGPVVLVVFDEFPVTTLLTTDGTINEARFPNFAELARSSTWFRNASSLSELTPWSVPQILSGVTGDGDELPMLADWPRNLFRLLGRDLDVNRYELVSDLCPELICTPGRRISNGRAFKEMGLLYATRILPADLRQQLPAVDNIWARYGVDAPQADTDPADLNDQAYDHLRNQLADRARLGQTVGPGQVDAFRETLDAIDGSGQLSFIHIGPPHYPWVLAPSGGVNVNDLPIPLQPGQSNGEFLARLGFQLHTMQVGTMDVLLGELVDRLKRLGVWDESIVVITSDHGTSLDPSEFAERPPKPQTYRIPLFIHAPGRDGGVDDSPAQTIDIVPSIVDLLDIEVAGDWAFDGHSLFDGSEATVTPLVSESVDEVLELVRSEAAIYSHDGGWDELAAVGTPAPLVGSSVASFEQGPPSDFVVRHSDTSRFDDLPLPDERLPIVINGRVASVATAASPPEFAVAVNGVIRGTAGGFEPTGQGSWHFWAYVGDVYRDGPNSVVLYEIAAEGETTKLRPLTDITDRG